MNIETPGEFAIVPENFTASFYGSPTMGYSDLVVQFTDQSVGYISTWEWDLDGDGLIDSNVQNPVWTYRQAGFYSVTLTISDGVFSHAVTRTNYIYVQPMNADFLVTETSGYVPLTVQFTDQTQSDVNIWS